MVNTNANPNNLHNANRSPHASCHSYVGDGYDQPAKKTSGRFSD